MQPWGTQTIEPIAQVIVRPNETNIGKLPNEDSQSLIFDDTNLFKIDKFAGWDRIEGGGRANVGIQDHHAVQSRRLHQHRVRPVVSIVRRQFVRELGDNTNTGLDSGLDTSKIRLRGAAFVPAGPHLFFQHALPVRPDTTSKSPAVRDRSPRKLRSLVGFHALRQVRRAAAARLPDAARGRPRQRLVKLSQNWLATASVRYDIDANSLAGTVFGIGYIDDCLIVA